MSCGKHIKDPHWQIDLIWKYLHEEPSKGKPISWYKKMDPTGDLDDRHRVYEMLVEQPAQSNPSTANGVKQSMIPWNQKHPGIVQAFKTEYACGSVVKITFQKYMGWGGDPVERKVGRKGFDAVAFIVRNLLNGKPVRARVASDHHGHHFVGIVGARVLGYLPAKKRNQWEFLHLDPWAGSVDADDAVDYGGGKSAFLGIIREQGDILTYGKHGQYLVHTVGGPIS